jgi:hypothetical protein
VNFNGPNPPQTADRIVIPYLRWENSVRGCVTDADCPKNKSTFAKMESASKKLLRCGIFGSFKVFSDGKTLAGRARET